MVGGWPKIIVQTIDALIVKYKEVPYYLDWPSRSPDLSPIENLWGELKRNVRKRFPQSLDELEEFIIQEWENISDQKVQNYCESFENRLKCVIATKGEKIDY